MWRLDAANTVSDVFGYIAVVQAYFKSIEEVYLIIFYFGVGIVVVFTFCIVYCYLMIKRQRTIGDSMVRFLRFSVHMLITVLFVPLFYTFLLIL